MAYLLNNYEGAIINLLKTKFHPELFCSVFRYVKGKAEVCLSTSPYRRYDWIKFKRGPVYGQSGNFSCQAENKVGIYSWTRFFVGCDTCVCLCDDPSSETTERYVSLLPSVTDLDKNMVSACKVSLPSW